MQFKYRWFWNWFCETATLHNESVIMWKEERHDEPSMLAVWLWPSARIALLGRERDGGSCKRIQCSTIITEMVCTTIPICFRVKQVYFCFVWYNVLANHCNCLWIPCNIEDSLYVLQVCSDAENDESENAVFIFNGCFSLTYEKRNCIGYPVDRSLSMSIFELYLCLPLLCTTCAIVFSLSEPGLCGCDVRLIWIAQF